MSAGWETATGQRSPRQAQSTILVARAAGGQHVTPREASHRRILERRCAVAVEPSAGSRVETREVLDKLGALGVEFAQGYYIARPTSVESFEPWDEDAKLLA